MTIRSSFVLVIAALGLAACSTTTARDSGPSDGAPPDAVGVDVTGDASGLDVQSPDAIGTDVQGTDVTGLDVQGTDVQTTDVITPTDVIVPTDVPTTPTCGDGFVTSPEQCDDGNLAVGDGCNASCQIEPTPTCGNGTVDRATGEQCDDGNTTAGDGCDGRCRIEAPSGCGNGVRDIAAGEECDDGNTRSGDGCSATCQLEPVGVNCGNGVTNPPEVCDDGNLTNGDACNPTCNLANTTSLFAGMPGMTGRVDGVGTAARFTSTAALATDDTYLWAAEAPGTGGTPGAVLRRIDIATGTVLTVATIGGSGGVATNGTSTVWVAGGNVIQSISTTAPFAVTNIHMGVAATNAATFRDGPPGTASFADVRGLTWFRGYLWIVDTAAAVIRRMDPATGNVTTVAGMPYVTGVGINGTGSAARFTSPRYIVSDNSGMLYISDTNGAAIRAMNATTFAVTTFAGLPGTAGYVDGVGAPVRIHRPRGITADASSVYFAEFNAQTIRQGILATGAVSTLVGTADTTAGSTGGYAEGVGTAALFAAPWGIAYHFPSRSLFISDGSRTIRRIR